MIYEEVRSADLPAADRFAWWRELTANSIIKSTVLCEHEADFQVSARSVQLGGVTVSRMTYSAVRYFRNRRMIRQSDPEQLILGLALSGRLGMTIDGTEQVAGPGTILVYDTSQPVHGWTTDPRARLSTQLLVQVPRTLLPLHANQIGRLVGTPLPGREGVGALTAGYLAGLVAHAERYRPADAARLRAVTLDLLTALFAHHLDTGTAVPPETRHEVLQVQLHEFVERRLGDPGLSPGMLAAAHHISLRQLHKLFHQQGLTVAGWIRQRRLEGCRGALADPAQRSRPAHVIARRYGFTSYAHFSRLFTARYGHSPSDYRRTVSTEAATWAEHAGGSTDTAVHGSS